MPAQFPNNELVACAEREVAMREKAYPKWENKETIVDCSDAKQKEYQMMQAIAEQLKALPELLKRYQESKAALRHLLPQPYTLELPAHDELVLVYCRSSPRPFLAKRVGHHKWQFEDNLGGIMEDGMDSQDVFMFSYLPDNPAV